HEILWHAAELRHTALHFLAHHPLVGQRVDQAGVTELPSFDIGAERRHLAGDVGTGDPRHWNRQTRHALAYEDVQVIQPTRLPTDQNVIRADHRIRKVAIDDVLDPALLLDHRCLHRPPLSPEPKTPQPRLLKRFIPVVKYNDACLPRDRNQPPRRAT